VKSLTSGVIDAVIAHARDASPAECCGVLIGRNHEIVDAVRTRNAADRPTRFVIEPQDHFAAIRAARAQQLEVVGYYHSHPHSPARPSETDIAEATYPDHVALIVSLASEPPELRLYWFDGRNFLEEPFVTQAR
jgi:proteasome lid subunit RPN8/RPN11